jgi:hypothetical protein
MDPIFYSVISLVVVFTILGAVLILALRSVRRTKRLETRGYRAARSYGTTRHRYIPGQFSEQMELDLRLPYRRFRQLYPENRWTYEEYKKMQMQTAFRRSYSSQDNKRMVR